MRKTRTELKKDAAKIKKDAADAKRIYAGTEARNEDILAVTSRKDMKKLELNVGDELVSFSRELSGFNRDLDKSFKEFIIRCLFGVSLKCRPREPKIYDPKAGDVYICRWINQFNEYLNLCDIVDPVKQVSTGDLILGRFHRGQTDGQEKSRATERSLR